MIPLLVLRHAPTEWNAQSRIQGRADPPLSASGRALAMAWRLPPGWQDAVCFCSPLRRATETARLLGLVPLVEPALIEMDWGEWEGRRLAELRAELGVDMSENERRGLDFRPPGGESPRDVQQRLLPFLAGLSQPAIAVTHKGVLRALYALASGWTMAGKPPQKLRDSCAHGFGVQPGGLVAVGEINIPLRPTQP